MAKTARTVLELVTNIDEYLSDLKKGEKGNDEFDKSVQKISKGFQSVGKDISSFGTGLSTWVTLPIGGAVAATGALVMSMADSADAIAKNAREAGLSADAYQELKFAIGQVGKMTEEQVDTAFRKLTLTIGDAAAGSDKAAEALRQLGYTQKEIGSGSITTEDAFNKLNTTMQGTASQAEAAALAGELVGDKIGPKLAAVLRTSGGEVEALRGQFKELGLGMSQDTLDASEKFKDELDVLERQLGAVGREIASELLPVIVDELIPFIQHEVVPRIREFAQWLGSLAKGFADLSPGMKGFIAGGIAMVAAIGPVLVIAGKLVTAFGVVLPAAIGATNMALGFLAANPIALAALGIAAALVAVKIAADDSTSAIRRQIQVANDYKTISDLWKKTTALTADEQKRLTEALERTEKQTYVNSKGLGSLAGFTTGLTVDIGDLAHELDQNASPALRRTKADQDRLQKAMEEAAKVAQKQDDALKQLSDRLTGKGLLKDMEQLAVVVGKWSEAELTAALRQGEVTKQVVAFREKGLALPPVLQDIWLAHERLNPSVQTSTDVYGDLAAILKHLPSIKLPPAPKNPWMTLPKGAGWASADAFMQEMTDRANEHTPKAGASIGSTLVGAFGRAIEGLGDVIVGALMGGGDVGKAAGAHIGKSLGDELGTYLTKQIGGSLGKLIGGFAGPLGALAGSMLGGVLDKAFSGNDTKKGRESLAKTLGFPSLAAMNDTLRSFGEDGQRLVNEGLNKIGKTDTAANDRWIESVKALVKANTAAKAAAAQAQADFNAEAKAMIPNWKTAGELAEKYGIDISALGNKFRQGGLSEATQEIYTDFQRLAAFIGEDMNEGVLRGMSDEISGLVAKSLAFGGEIPKQMQPMILKLQEMGLLVDENGQKLEGVENLKFGETMQETTLSLIDAMKELAAVMRGDITSSIKGVKDVAKVVAGDMRKLFAEPIPITFKFDTDGTPNFNGGGGGGKPPAAADFGGFMADGWYGRVFRPTVFVAGEKPGGEDVAFSGVGRSFRGGGGSRQPLVIHNIMQVDGRTMARSTRRYLGEDLDLAGYPS